MRRLAAVMVAVMVATGLAACSSGPSEHERAEFNKFAAERQADYPSVMPASVPTSIKEYVIGGEGITTADYIVAGSFTGGRTAPAPPGTNDSTAYTLIGEFRLHQSLRGEVPSTFDVNLGTASVPLVAATAMKGAGDVVLFLSYDTTSSSWVLVDGKYALAQSDGGDLSMPLVPASMETQYMTGVVDLADVQGMIIAANLDPNGSLNGGLDNIGNEGVNQYDDLIDQANDLTD